MGGWAGLPKPLNAPDALENMSQFGRVWDETHKMVEDKPRAAALVKHAAILPQVVQRHRITGRGVLQLQQWNILAFPPTGPGGHSRARRT